MKQQIYSYSSAGEEVLILPAPEEEVMPGVKWDKAEYFYTPAFWAAQAWLKERHNPTLRSFRVGETLQEELVFCLLSGYGISAEMAYAAFQRLRECEIVPCNRKVHEHEIQKLLLQPLKIGNKSARYRFPNQKSRFLTEAINRLQELDASSMEGKLLRNELSKFPGIGLKTASFITRNWSGSNEVAIIDIHIYRAGVIAGIFSKRDRVETAYLRLEDTFIDFAYKLGASPASLDLMMWEDMRLFGSDAIRAFENIH